MNAPHVNNGSSSKIDWSDIHRRLDKVTKALELGTIPDAEKSKRILSARATALAHPKKAEKSPAESMEIVEFLLADERYAVDSSFVREVQALKELTPLPGTPPFVAGIIHLRGQIISVLDLKGFFNLPARGLTDLNKAIVVSNGGMEVALLVDAVKGITRLAMSDIQPPPPSLRTGIRHEYLKGITGERVVVLDPGKILSDPRIIVSQQVEHTAAGRIGGIA
jgi:purine-binding chemotaxis protein CheW